MDKRKLLAGLAGVKKGCTDALVERNVGGALTGDRVINTEDDFDDAMESVRRDNQIERYRRWVGIDGESESFLDGVSVHPEYQRRVDKVMKK